MVISPARIESRSRHGALIMELVVALGILVGVVLPLAFGFLMESHAIRSSYFDVVIMELVDGEMEILAAGDWSRFPEGQHPYPVKSAALTNLPRGTFQLTRAARKLRLEWVPGEGVRHRSHMREVVLP